MIDDSWWTFRVKATYSDGTVNVDYWPRFVEKLEDIQTNLINIRGCFKSDVKLDITYKQGWTDGGS